MQLEERSHATSSEQVITEAEESYVRRAPYVRKWPTLLSNHCGNSVDGDAYCNSLDNTYLICVPLRRVFPLGSAAMEKPVASDSHMCCVSSSLLFDVTTTRLATRKEE